MAAHQIVGMVHDWAMAKTTKTSPQKADQTLLILGASGDLTGRLLLPGLAGLLARGHSQQLTLVGSGIEDWSAEKWKQRVTSSFATVEASGRQVTEVINNTVYHQADVTEVDDLQRLLAQCEGSIAIFFALPPPITVKVCQALLECTLGKDTRLVLEKPFGTDVSSATDLNALLTRLVPEEQVHRVDHFLGTSSVLNILGLRFTNRIFEPLLNADHVERVEIVYDEVLGLEGRARYYDGAGAMVDMIQSHLLQVLAVMAMEPPPTLRAVDFRDQKAQVLRATRVWQNDPVTSSRRGRYTAGKIGRRTFMSYEDETGVDPSRHTETLAEVDFEVNTWRWAGVPFRVRSGKAIGEPRNEIAITFKPAQQVPVGFHGAERPDQLRMLLKPDGLSLDINVNGPGNPFVVDSATLTADFGAGELEAYGEVLELVLDHDPTLSIRGDTAVECWQIIEPVIDAWRADQVPLDDYPAGSHGPESWPG